LKTKRVLGFCLVSAFASLGWSPAAATAQALGVAPEARTIRVSGVGEVRTEPDLATLQFAVETTGATAQQAGRENADLMERVIQALVGAGVRREDISTSGYSLYPEYASQARPGTDPPTIRGYRAMNQVAVRTPTLERLGPLIDTGLEAGANRLSGVFFELRDTRMAQSQALRLAVEDARNSAETIAGALGVRLGAVLDASTSSEPPRPFFRATARDGSFMEGVAMAQPTPIEPGEQTVRAMASIVYAIE